MSTLKEKDFEIMERQIRDSKGKMIKKEDVLRIIQNKLKQVDERNNLIVDRIDGVALKEVLNSINKIN